jgi:hypothetical protein
VIHPRSLLLISLSVVCFVFASASFGALLVPTEGVFFGFATAVGILFLLFF